MKKIIPIALALVLALSLLTACGGKDNNSTPSGNGGSNAPSTSQGGNNTPSNNGGNTATDTSTVAGYLAQYGWTEADIKPEGFTDFSYTQGGKVTINVSNPSDPAAAQAWVEQIYNKSKELSDDGKVWVAVGALEYNLANSKYDYSKLNTYNWSYEWNGKQVTLVCNNFFFGFAE